jgi:D-alanyl-D-alanine carboxypeptidase
VTLPRRSSFRRPPRGVAAVTLGVTLGVGLAGGLGAGMGTAAAADHGTGSRTTALDRLAASPFGGPAPTTSPGTTPSTTQPTSPTTPTTTGPTLLTTLPTTPPTTPPTRTAGTPPSTTATAPRTSVPRTPARPSPSSTTASPASPTGPDALPPASVTDPQAPSSDNDAPLTPEQVRSQVAQADALRAQLAATDVGLGAASSALQMISQQVSSSLEQQQVALGEERAARVEQVRQQQLLRTLRGSLEQRRRSLGQWARTAYTVGGPMAAYETWLTVLYGSSAGDVGHDLALLRQVGVTGSEQVQELKDAARAQQTATRQAALSAARAQAARQRADTAASQARQLLSQQRAALARLQGERARLVGAARFTDQQRSALEQVQSVLPAQTTGRCAGRSTAGYANGAIPASALCPLWGAPGQALRADAAAGFERLAQAYAAEFASPLCVTDSYRPLAVQVRLFAEKPALAAHPGTSNHGWGTALDLCGGIQSFGTLQHAWMLSHAPLYGWFHPAWAEPTGSRPEPWHWEFAG